MNRDILRNSVWLSVILASVVATALPFNNRTQKVVETIITCQQVNNDQWIEMGIARNESHNLQAFVISHVANRGTSTLLAKLDVSEVYRGQARAYHDRSGFFRLLITWNANGVSGEASLRKKGLKPVSEKSLVCLYDDKVTFDQ